ncbi:Mog1p/PsbP-like protein [Stemphylium lycopersici]|nr:Mog1p/PsbP-like protein [Stemphylium lycopersici]
MAYKNTSLYGGAITVDLPSNFADASLIRQIPDHQEVYLDNNGYTSIVVEILEYVDKSSDDEALQFHFGDLVEGTGDATTIVAQERESMEGIGNNPVLSLTFIQTPPPPTDPTPKRKTPEYTFIQLLLIRLKEHGTDLMISINTPHYPAEHTPASEPGGETQLMRESKAMRQKVLESFTIKEWGLFEG